MTGANVFSDFVVTNGIVTAITSREITYGDVGAAATDHDHAVADITDFPASMPASDVYTWAKAATAPTYTNTDVGAAATDHDHVKADITDFPTIPTTLPASDVYSWAKAATKPTYTYDEVGAAESSHSHSYLPLSGGTLTGSITLPGSVVLAKDGSYNALRVSNPSGYIQIGPLNEGLCHIYTDRPSFYFNKALSVNGTAVSMDGHNHSAANITSGSFPVAVRAATGTDYTTRRPRNISAGTAAPSGGSNGDVYIKYT